MSYSQLPLLFVLLAALALVLFLLVRHLRADAGSATTTAAPRRAAASAHQPDAAGTNAASSIAPPIASWGYQLQKLDIGHAAASPYDLLVIDPTLDGTVDTALTRADLARLQSRPDGQRRRVLAYLSIGEAESYRAYWDNRWAHSKPDWLLGENPQWKQNYAVCFWNPDWQGLMCGAPEAGLDRILASGFDGVYLDKCDVVDDLKRRYKDAAASRTDLEGDMVRFIAQLSDYAKARSPNFLVVMQNAESLLDRAGLRQCLDGAAKEELIYGGNGPEKLNAPADLAQSRRLFDQMLADGKFVLAVEYLNDDAKIQHALATLRGFNYAPCISAKNRKLDRLDYDLVSA